MKRLKHFESKGANQDMMQQRPGIYIQCVNKDLFWNEKIRMPIQIYEREVQEQ